MGKLKQTNNTTIDNLCLLVQKGLIDDNGIHGVSRNVALAKIDEYLQEYDKQELLLDIIGALVDGGFLPKSLDVKKLKKAVKMQTGKINQAVEESLPHSEKNGEL